MAEQSVSHKTCLKCKGLKPLTDYQRNKSRKDGRGEWCRPCCRAYRIARNPPPPPADDLPGEAWRDVVGFEGYYSVSNMGRIKSVGGRYHKRGQVLKPSLNQGYLQVTMCKDTVETTRKIHVLVLAAFVGPCPTGSEGNHIDRDRANNRLDNLEYLTRHENILYSIVNDRHHLAVLTPEDVRAIRRLDKEGCTPAQIREQFPHVDRASIYNVRKGRTWKYLR